MVGPFLYLKNELQVPETVYYPVPAHKAFPFQSVDTMKYSRDLSREKLKNESFDKVIDAQIAAIAETGATHVAIATPYDEEFFPFLERWVVTARKYHLHVWFRGNWSGWEKWFDYKSITREEHQRKTEEFILRHKDIFQDGDVFSSCPECENGGPGDPRQTGDVVGYRQFLIAEYQAMREAFRHINKDVRANFFSMNGDVARLIMNKETTQALGGIVVIDHYVKTPEKLAQDVIEIAEQSGGHVVLGEVGAPILDIHGTMSDAEQAQWLNKAMQLLYGTGKVVGVNYWLSVGGATEIWRRDNTPKEAVAVLGGYFKPLFASGFVKDELGKPLKGVTVKYNQKTQQTDAHGYFEVLIPVGLNKADIHFEKSGYQNGAVKLTQSSPKMDVTLERTTKDLHFRVLQFLKGWL